MISKRVLFEKVAEYPDAATPISVWFETVRAADWASLEDIRRTYPSCDMIGPIAIFNVRGNRYRLIVRISFAGQRVYIKEFLTHAEYSQERWHKWL